MGSAWKAGLGILVAGAIIIQFFGPDKNNGEKNPEGGLLYAGTVPNEVAVILKGACFDCHSNHTRYPWYGRIEPVSWILGNHIRDGKKSLNFDQWEDLETRDKIGILGEICDELESSGMPLSGYVRLHEEARLTEAQVELICNWADKEALRIMRR